MPPVSQATATFAPDFGAQGEAVGSRWPGWARRLLGALQSIPAEARDRSTGLYNRSGLITAANEAIRAGGAGLPVSMVVLDFADLREVYHIYGSSVARLVVERLVRRLRSLAGSRGFAGRTGQTQFTLVLPGATRDKAVRRIQQSLGKPARLEVDAGDSEIVLVPDLLIETAQPGASVQALYDRMCGELARIRSNELRRLNWLTSERERHSRPMSLPAR